LSLQGAPIGRPLAVSYTGVVASTPSRPARDPLTPSVGWGVLHLFLKVGPNLDTEAVVDALKTARAEGDQVVTAAMLGHKADVGVMALGPDLWRLRSLQSALVGAGLEATGSYVSLTEVSEYAQGVPEEMKQARLYPTLPPPGKAAFCFYPMSKRRSADHNWYATASCSSSRGRRVSTTGSGV
jgi:peroxiredoxin